MPCNTLPTQTRARSAASAYSALPCPRQGRCRCADNNHMLPRTPAHIRPSAARRRGQRAAASAAGGACACAAAGCLRAQVRGQVAQVRGRGRLGQWPVMLKQRQVARVLLKVRGQARRVEQLLPQLFGARLPARRAGRLRAWRRVGCMETDPAAQDCVQRSRPGQRAQSCTALGHQGARQAHHAVQHWLRLLSGRDSYVKSGGRLRLGAGPAARSTSQAARPNRRVSTPRQRPCSRH